MPLPIVNLELAATDFAKFLEQVAQRGFAASKFVSLQSLITDEINDQRNDLEQGLESSGMSDSSKRLNKIVRAFKGLQLTEPMVIEQCKQSLTILIQIQMRFMDQLTEILNISVASMPSYEFSHLFSIIEVALQALSQIFPAHLQEEIIAAASRQANTSPVNKPLLLQAIHSIDKAAMQEMLTEKTTLREQCHKFI